MLTHEEFLEHLRRALNHLYEPDRLRQNPLAVLLGVANRLDTFSTLQKILIEAIESLEPEADAAPQSYAWEIYEPLFYRYVQQSNQQLVAKQLGMSVRHLRRKEHAALEVLASRLWEQFDLEAKLRGDTGEAPAPAQVMEDSPTVSEELAWLKDIPPESPINLSQMLLDILDLARPLAAQYDVRLDVSMADDLPSLMVHKVALSQALLNLLSVAIHRASCGDVSVCTRALPLEAKIQIQGTQSPSGIQPSSEDDAASLVLAHQLVDICGCKLTLFEDEEVFSATLTVPAIEQLPVLVIDDNADTLQLLRRYAVGTRYRLITTQDPQQALILAERFSPKTVVLDVMMPRVDGWKVLAQLRQYPPTEHTPIIVCTILPQEEMAFALGASGFVRKPVTRQAFLAALDQQVALMEKEPR